MTGLTAGETYDFVVEARNLINYSVLSQSLQVTASEVPSPPQALDENFADSNASQISLVWVAPAFEGGLSVIDYRLWYWSATDSISVYEQSIAATNYLATTFELGKTYWFKVEARNADGYSFFSNVKQVTAVQLPSQPAAPVTTWDIATDEVTVSWIAPFDGGYALTGYSVTIKQTDGSFSETATCDMTSSTSTECKVHVGVLRSAAYSLDWGQSVYAKVRASNVYGSSPYSDEGNGAIITTSPGAPISLAEVYEQRTKSTLGISW